MPELKDLQPGDTLVIVRYNCGIDPLRIETVERVTATQMVSTGGSRWQLSSGRRIKHPDMRRCPEEHALAEKAIGEEKAGFYRNLLKVKAQQELAEAERFKACQQLECKLSNLQHANFHRRLPTADAKRLTDLIADILKPYVTTGE